MFTIEEINEEANKFKSYIQANEFPIINDIIYTNIKSNATIKHSDIVNNKYIIYLNHKINNYDILYQRSIIWHEFTHIFDFIKYKNKYNDENLKKIMKTYSEANASSIQLRYLTNISISEKIINRDILIQYGTKNMTHQELTANYLNLNIEFLNNYDIKNNPEDFHVALNNFFYFCGYISVRTNPQKLLNIAMSLYPNNKYKTDLKLMGEAVLHKNIPLIIKLYTDMCFQAIEQAKNFLLNHNQEGSHCPWLIK